HVRQRERLYRQRAERMPEVVEAEPRKAGAIERVVKPATQTGVVDVLTEIVYEHEIVRPGEPLAAAEPVERLRGLVDQRYRAHLPGLRRPDRTVRVVRPDVNEPL